MISINDHGYGNWDFANIVRNRPEKQIPIIFALANIESHVEDRSEERPEFIHPQPGRYNPGCIGFEKGLDTGVEIFG